MLFHCKEQRLQKHLGGFLVHLSVLSITESNHDDQKTTRRANTLSHPGLCIRSQTNNPECQVQGFPAEGSIDPGISIPSAQTPLCSDL